MKFHCSSGMGFYQLKQEQFLKTNLDEVWNFISLPKNLKEITPDYMGFDITSNNLSEKMYEGMIISYKVSPLLKFKTTWVTEITKVKERRYFVDEQRVGPYKVWHHEHFIKEVEGGVLMYDIVSYQPPFGVLGSLMNSIIIKRKLNEIFDYRRKVLEKKYNSY